MAKRYILKKGVFLRQFNLPPLCEWTLTDELAEKYLKNDSSLVKYFAVTPKKVDVPVSKPVSRPITSGKKVVDESVEIVEAKEDVPEVKEEVKEEIPQENEEIPEEEKEEIQEKLPKKVVRKPGKRAKTKKV